MTRSFMFVLDIFAELHLPYVLCGCRVRMLNSISVTHTLALVELFANAQTLTHRHAELAYTQHTHTHTDSVYMCSQI